MTLPYESRDVINFKKFGIGWCIHHRMAADNPKAHLIGITHQNLFLIVQPTDVEYPNNAVM